MEITKAVAEAKRIIGPDVVLEKKHGTCYIRRGEEILAAQPSWLAALRYAAKPVIEKLRAEEAEDQRQVMLERNLFEDFLRETLLPQFEKWKADRAGTPDAPDQPTPAPATP